MNKTILQIPMDKDLKQKAQDMAIASGFSSVQEVVRVFLHNFTEQKLEVQIMNTDRLLSPEAEKRYAMLTEDFKAGKNVLKADSIDDLMNKLHEDTLS